MEGYPVICGGILHQKDCIVFGSSQNVVFEMEENRQFFSAVSLNSSILWLLGSDTGPSSVQYSTELISLREGNSLEEVLK